MIVAAEMTKDSAVWKKIVLEALTRWRKNRTDENATRSVIWMGVASMAAPEVFDV